MDQCKYCGEPLTWLISIKSYSLKIWKPTTVICPNCNNENYPTGKSSIILSLLISTPFIFLINYLEISKYYKLLMFLAWVVLIELISPFINKYSTEEEHNEDKFKYNLEDEKQTIESLAKLPNKQFIFTCLHMLHKGEKLTDSCINLLSNRDYCNTNFSCPYAILLEVSTIGEISIKYYSDGDRRYYPERYIINGKAYVATNHWYGPQKLNPDNRTPFMEWVMNLLA